MYQQDHAARPLQHHQQLLLHWSGQYSVPTYLQQDLVWSGVWRWVGVGNPVTTRITIHQFNQFNLGASISIIQTAILWSLIAVFVYPSYEALISGLASHSPGQDGKSEWSTLIGRDCRDPVLSLDYYADAKVYAITAKGKKYPPMGRYLGVP